MELFKPSLEGSSCVVGRLRAPLVLTGGSYLKRLYTLLDPEVHISVV